MEQNITINNHGLEEKTRKHILNRLDRIEKELGIEQEENGEAEESEAELVIEETEEASKEPVDSAQKLKEEVRQGRKEGTKTEENPERQEQAEQEEEEEEEELPDYIKGNTREGRRKTILEYLYRNREKSFTLREIMADALGIDNAYELESKDSDYSAVYNTIYRMENEHEDPINKDKIDGSIRYTWAETESKEPAKLSLEEASKNEETELPEFNEGERIDDPQYFDVTERKDIIKEMLSIKPLTKKELTREMYNLEPGDESAEYAGKHHNAVVSAIQRLREDEEIVEADRVVSGNSMAFTVPDSDSVKEEETGDDGNEADGTPLGIAQKKSGVGEDELRSIENALSKVVHMAGEEEVTYYDFEQNYGGQYDGITAWQKLFQYTDLLSEISDRVLDEQGEFNWQQTDGNGVKSWKLVIK